MTPRISDDLQQAAEAQVGGPLKAEHEPTHKVYFIYTEQQHQEATRALQAQADNRAIAEGIRQMEKGEGRPLQEVDADMRKEFDLPPRP